MLHMLLAGTLTLCSWLPAAPAQPALARAIHAPTYAYYCASGNTVKYHSSATCRGLNRCSAEVKKLTLEDAQQRMAACKLCH